MVSYYLVAGVTSEYALLKPSSNPQANLVQSLLKATESTFGSAVSLMGRLVSMTVAQSWYRTVMCTSMQELDRYRIMVHEQFIFREDLTGSGKRCVANTKDTVLVIDR